MAALGSEAASLPVDPSSVTHRAELGAFEGRHQVRPSRRAADHGAVPFPERSGKADATWLGMITTPEVGWTVAAPGHLAGSVDLFTAKLFMSNEDHPIGNSTTQCRKYCNKLRTIVKMCEWYKKRNFRADRTPGAT